MFVAVICDKMKLILYFDEDWKSVDRNERLEIKHFNILLKRAKYSEKAFDELYTFYYSRIVRHLEISYGRALSEDVAQEFFMNLIVEDKDYDYVYSPTSWVYRCCENIAKRKITYDSRYALYGDFTEKEAASSVLLKQIEGSESVEKLLANFDDEAKRIIYLVYWEGYNFRETAEILSINYATIRKKHSRLIKKLKKASQFE